MDHYGHGDHNGKAVISTHPLPNFLFSPTTGITLGQRMLKNL